MALIGVILVILDVTIAGLLSIGSSFIQPSLTLPLVVYVGINSGPIVGTLVGAATGLLLDLIGGTALGGTVFAYCVAGFFCGKLWDDGPVRIFWPWGAFLLVSAIFSQVVFHYLYSRGSGVDFAPLFMQHGLPAAAYTTVLGLIWFLSPLHRVR
jgi:cell shape-determining protein MreD